MEIKAVGAKAKYASPLTHSSKVPTTFYWGILEKSPVYSGLTLGPEAGVLTFTTTM